MSMKNYQYKLVKPDSLKVYGNNARTHSDDQINQLVTSIKEFGFTNPVLIDSHDELIAGHARTQAAQVLELEEIPAIVIDGLTPDQQKALVLADNQLALNAGWDLELLKLEINDLIEADYDIGVVGFDDKFLNDLMLPKDINLDDEVLPEPPANPVTALGDVWHLGDHKVICGDSTDQDVLDKLMEGKKANMCFTDPPYNMDFTGGIHADGSKSYKAKHGAIKNDKKTKEEADAFFDDVNMAIKTHVDGAFYITFYRLGINTYYASLARVGLHSRSLIIWDKGNHTLSNSDYKSMYEPIFYGWVNRHKFYGGKNGMDIWRIDRTKKNELHPTMKPIELVDKALKDGSQINNIVLDLFLGSGTTLISCEKNRRICYGVELDEKYVDVIIERWQSFTGLEAKRADGLAYNHLKGEKHDQLSKQNKNDQKSKSNTAGAENSKTA